MIVTYDAAMVTDYRGHRRAIVPVEKSISKLATIPFSVQFSFEVIVCTVAGVTAHSHR